MRDGYYYMSKITLKARGHVVDAISNRIDYLSDLQNSPSVRKRDRWQSEATLLENSRAISTLTRIEDMLYENNDNIDVFKMVNLNETLSDFDKQILGRSATAIIDRSQQKFDELY